MYDTNMVAPMRNELTDSGVVSLETSEAVDEALGSGAGTQLVIVNSVCGCAAANARPGARLVLDHPKKPDLIATVFAGVDKEATDKARSYFTGYMPSSPSMALLKDGECVFMLQRHEIEGRAPEDIAGALGQAFEEHCTE